MSAKKADVPVYVVCGFLDAGKTTFLKSVLTPDGLADGSRTLLITCEEGETDFDDKALAARNIRRINIEEREELTRDFLLRCDKEYKPEQVLFEYNGMWLLQELGEEILPANWVLYQIVHVAEAATFENYAANMASLMMEKLRNADMIIFNRCTPALRETLRRRNLKMLNRRATIYLDFTDGTTEDYDSGVPPFDMSTPVLELSDDDYGVWYTDAMDHPDRYEGHAVRYRGMVARSPKFPKGSLVAGRFAMVCCANDAQFFGMIIKTPDVEKFKSRDWVEVTAVVKVEEQKLFQGPGPVLYASEIKLTDPPKEELVTF